MTADPINLRARYQAVVLTRDLAEEVLNDRPYLLTRKVDIQRGDVVILTVVDRPPVGEDKGRISMAGCPVTHVQHHRMQRFEGEPFGIAAGWAIVSIDTTLPLDLDDEAEAMAIQAVHDAGIVTEAKPIDEAALAESMARHPAGKGRPEAPRSLAEVHEPVISTRVWEAEGSWWHQFRDAANDYDGAVTRARDNDAANKHLAQDVERYVEGTLRIRVGRAEREAEDAAQVAYQAAYQAAVAAAPNWPTTTGETP